MMAKRDTASRAIDAIRGAFKNASVRRLSEGTTSEVREVIPTGLDVLDNWVFGCGGIPAGRMIEMYAAPDSGKTSLALQFMAATQRAGGLACMFESENTLQSARAKTFGVDLDDAIIVEKASTEDFLGQMAEMLKSIPNDVGPNLIVWDSIAATVLDKQLEDSGASVMGKKAAVMSAVLPVVNKLASEKRCAIVLVNQVRQKLGVAFGDPTTTPGGETHKFLASTRLQMWRSKQFERDNVAAGHYVTVKSMKSKTTTPGRKIKLKLDYRHGWDNEWAVIDLAKELDLIPATAKASADTLKAAYSALEQHPEWFSPDKKMPDPDRVEEPAPVKSKKAKAKAAPDQS